MVFSEWDQVEESLDAPRVRSPGPVTSYRRLEGRVTREDVPETDNPIDACVKARRYTLTTSQGNEAHYQGH